MKSLSSLTMASLLLAAGPLFAETVAVEPGRSLQEAADKLQPGDTLLLAEGTYYQSFRLKKSGTAGNPITIKAKTPGKVILTGAMETPPGFEKVEGAIYKTKWGGKGSKTGQAWVIADDRNLYNYTSREQMNTFQHPSSQPGEKAPQGGFFCEGGEMYVRLLGGADPNKAKMAISRPDASVLLEIQGQQHIVLEGLRFHVAPAAAVRLGTRALQACSHIVVRDCSFFGCRYGITGQAAEKGDERFGTSDITVEYCQFSNYPTYQWLRYGQLQMASVYGAIYDSVLGGAGIAPGGRAYRWKIRHCYLHDCFDGIEPASTADEDPALVNEYAYNLFHNCGDDSIELDAIEYAGVLVHHNVLLDGFTHFGLSPVQAGGVTIEHNLLYVSPEYGLLWCVIFKFSTPSSSAFHRGGFHPLTGMTIRNNTLVNTTSGVQWGASSRRKPYYFKDNTVANNILFARDWVSWHGLPWQLGLEVEKNNLCCGPAVRVGKDDGTVPEGMPCTRDTEPFIRRDTHRWDSLPPLLPELAAEGAPGEEKEIGRVNFSISEDYVQAALKENGLDAAAYKDICKNLGAIRPGTKWEFPRPGPRWSVGESALFHPPFPPSLDPWWVGFADKPSDVKTVRIKPWQGKFYRDVGSLAHGAKVTASSYLTGKNAEKITRWGRQADCGPDNAVDGNPDSGWYSDAANEETADKTAWLEIDLGRVQPLNFIELAKTGGCSKIDIVVKREDRWEAIHTFDIETYKGNTYSSRVPLTEARYVRIVPRAVVRSACVSEVRLLRVP